VPCGDLKNWCDGGVPINVKGDSSCLHDEVIIIVTANRSLAECYAELFIKHPMELQALRERFVEVNSLEFYQDLRGKGLIPSYPPYEPEPQSPGLNNGERLSGNEANSPTLEEMIDDSNYIGKSTYISQKGDIHDIVYHQRS